MSEVWCVTEVSCDEDTPSIQHISIKAYIDADEAEMRLGSSDMRKLEQDRNGIKVGRFLALRYCSPDFSVDDIDREDISMIGEADCEGREVLQAIRKSSQITGNLTSNGIIIGKSAHVIPAMRGQKTCRRLLQELRRQHCGMRFHYAHRSVPQEGASLSEDFERRFKALKKTYVKAEVGLFTPDEENYPEVMMALWEGVNGTIDDCPVDWEKFCDQFSVWNDYRKAA